MSVVFVNESKILESLRSLTEYNANLVVLL